MSRGDRTPRARGIRQRAVRKAQRRGRRVALRSGVAAAAVSLAMAGTSPSTAGQYPSPRPERGLRLLKDIAPGERLSYPGSLTDVRGTLYFIATDDRHGRELWKSDGTSRGTVMVKDIRRGSQESWPQQLTAVGDEVFFTANDGIHGRELWRSDGTRSGTVMVRDIDPSDVDGYYPKNLTNVGDRIFFLAEDGVHGRGLWRSDGARRGTKLVKDINPTGPPSEEPWYASHFAAVGQTLFFSADDDVHGDELWRSDGTTRGTVLVKDIEPGSDDSTPEAMVSVGHELFFAATESHGRELWKSDGSASGTMLVKDISPPEYGDEGGPYPLGRLGDRLIFEARGGGTDQGVWVSDGTASGTVFLHRADPDFPGARLGRGGSAELYFITDYAGLWKTDGTPSGTALVTDLPTFNACDHLWCSEVGWLTEVHGDLFFSLHNYGVGSELWTSDGTKRGTGLVEDVVRGQEGSYPSYLTDSGGRLFYVVRVGEHGEEVYEEGGPLPRTPRCEGLKPTIAGFDQIIGTPGDDVIVGSAGADTIDGRGGHDVICGGAGRDVIDGGPGSDVIRGGAGPDTVDYSTRTAPVRVSLDSRSGDDDGGPGERDDVRGVEGAVGGSADDVLIGSPRADTLDGGGGDDRVDGRDGDDVEYGGDGDDVFVTGEAADGADVLEGQAGTDIADYSERTTALHLEMSISEVGDDGAPGEGDNLHPTTEGVRGGTGDDEIAGTMFDNLIWGGPGDDDIIGRRGDDTIDGGAGDDSLDTLDRVVGNDQASGGPGADTALFDPEDVITEVP